MLKKIETKIIADILPSKATESADVIFGAAVLAETDGTFLAASGDVHTLTRGTNPPKDLYPDWKIFSDIAKAMDVGHRLRPPAGTGEQGGAMKIGHQPRLASGPGLADLHAAAVPGCVVADAADRDRRIELQPAATEGPADGDRGSCLVETLLVDETEYAKVGVPHGFGDGRRFRDR